VTASRTGGRTSLCLPLDRRALRTLADCDAAATRRRLGGARRKKPTAGPIGVTCYTARLEPRTGTVGGKGFTRDGSSTQQTSRRWLRIKAEEIRRENRC
jgi:hypothetical protein